MRGRSLRLGLAFLIPFGAAGLLAQETSLTPPAVEADTEELPRFEAEVEQVTVDLVVTDGKGDPVAGLEPEDMTVTEDGIPQE